MIFDPELFKVGTKLRVRCCDSNYFAKNKEWILFKKRDYITTIFKYGEYYIEIPTEDNPNYFVRIYVNGVKNGYWQIEII